MNFKLFLCFPLLFLMTDCKTQKTETSGSESNNITIGLNKTVKIPNSKISLQFKNIAEDSRCPVGVTCVWEGVAIVNMEAKSAEDIKNFQIATRDFGPKNASKSIEYKGYILTLQNVNNPQLDGKEAETAVTVHYEKSSENSRQ